MTPTTLAETILRDVPRYSLTQLGPVEGGQWLHYPDVLAALTTAMDPALSERAVKIRDDLSDQCFPPDAALELAAADMLTALLAQNAALRAAAAWYEQLNKHNSHRAEAAEAVAEKLRGALTPSGETKAAYMGEFSFADAITDEDGNEVTVRVTVPWPTIKEIMAAIRARATLTTEAGK